MKATERGWPGTVHMGQQTGRTQQAVIGNTGYELKAGKKPSKGNVCVWDIPEKSRQICSKWVNEVTQPKQDGVVKR